jgi:fatty acid desaturase
MAKYGQLGLITAPPPNRPAFAARHILRPLLMVDVPASLAASFSWRGCPRRETAARYLYWGAVVAGAYLTGRLDELALFWLVPFCSTNHVFRYWSDIADHAGLYSEDPWRASRSWEGSWLAEQLIGPHSAHLHFPHHLFPLVPHYRERELHSLLMQVPEYAAGHHCNGFFWKRRADAPSVLQDILRGELPRSEAPSIRKPTASAPVH